MSIANGELVKGNNSPAVFFIENGTKRWVPDPATLVSRWSWEMVRTVPDEELDLLPKGPDIPSVNNHSTIKEGELVKGSSPAVFFIENGTKRYIPDPDTLVSRWTWEMVRTVPDEELNSIPEGPMVPSVNTPDNNETPVNNGNNLQIFKVNASTPDDGIAHGRAQAKGSVFAGASFRRGIDLSAGFNLEASAEGILGKEIGARLVAGISAQGGVSLQAALPLDLFSESGLVARFKAQAEAAAFVNLALSLELPEFYNRLGLQLPSPLHELLPVFLDELEVSGGLWARAAFAAEVHGHAVLAGSLLPTVEGGSGFSFSMGYGAGWGLGTGYGFTANLGFTDPRRLLERLSDKITSMVLQEVEQLLDGNARIDPNITQSAIAATRLLLPLTTRMLYGLGVELTEPDSAKRKKQTEASVINAFLEQAQNLTLHGLAEVALAKLKGLLQPETILGLVLSDKSKVEEVKNQVNKIQANLIAIQEIKPATNPNWVTTILPLTEELLASVDGLMKLNALPPKPTQEIRDGLATLGTAIVLLRRVILWYEDSKDKDLKALFDSSVASINSNSILTEHITQALQKPAGSNLSFSDLVTFLLLNDNVLANLRGISPHIDVTLDWVTDFLGVQPSELLRFILTGFTNEAERDRLLQQLGIKMSSAVQDLIVPNVIEPIRSHHRDNEGIQLLLDELIIPGLVALPVVVLPKLPTANTEEGALRLREAISALLLQTLGRFTIASINVLLEYALTAADDSINNVVAQIEAAEKQWSGLTALSMVASRAVLPISITPDDVQGILRLTADVIRNINQKQREPLMQALGELIRLGLADNQGRTVTLDGLLSSEEPPSSEKLTALLDHIMAGTWETAQLVGLRLLELVGMHYINEVKLFVSTIVEGSKAVVKAVEEGIKHLGEVLENLVQRLQELAGKAIELAGQLAGLVRSMAEHLQNFNTALIERVREIGLNMLPDFGKDIYKGAYNLAFDAAKWALNAPLELLASISGWLEEMLASAVQYAVSPEAIKQEIRHRISSSGAAEMRLRFVTEILGKEIELIPAITISAGNILGALADLVLADPFVNEIIYTAVRTADNLRAVRAEEATLTQMRDSNVQNQQQALAEFARLTPGNQLAVTIHSPVNQEVAQDSAQLQIQIQGANLTFVQQTMGVPPRVAIQVNGLPYEYPAAAWMEQNGGIELKVNLVAVTPAAPEIEILNIPIQRNLQPISYEIQVMQLAGQQPSNAQLELAESEPMYLRAGSLQAIPTAVKSPRRVMEPLPVLQGLAVNPSMERRINRQALASEVIPESARIVASGSIIQRPGISRSRNLADQTQLAQEIGHRLTLLLPELPVVGALPGLNVVQVVVSDGKTEQASAQVVFYINTK